MSNGHGHETNKKIGSSIRTNPQYTWMTQDEKFPNRSEIKKVLENMNIKFL